jgi:hypothetical protein
LPTWTTLSAHRVLNRIEIEKYGIHRHAIAAAIRETVALGFVEITAQGRAGNAEWRTPSRYGLTYRHADGLPGDGTHEWRKIKDQQEAELTANLARKAKPGKTKLQWRKTPVFGGEKRTENRRFHSVESATTGFSADSATTIDISGWGRTLPPHTRWGETPSTTGPPSPDERPSREGHAMSKSKRELTMRRMQCAQAELLRQREAEQRSEAEAKAEARRKAKQLRRWRDKRLGTLRRTIQASPVGHATIAIPS